VGGDPNWKFFHVLLVEHWKMWENYLEGSQKLNICWQFCWHWCHDAHNKQTHYFWIYKSAPWWGSRQKSKPLGKGWMDPKWNHLIKVGWTLRYRLDWTDVTSLFGWNQIMEPLHTEYTGTTVVTKLDGTKKWNHSIQGPGCFGLIPDGMWPAWLDGTK
jgi:hypothetical protein